MDYHSSYPVIMQLNYYKVYHSPWWASIMDCADIVIDRVISPKIVIANLNDVYLSMCCPNLKKTTAANRP